MFFVHLSPLEESDCEASSRETVKFIQHLKDHWPPASIFAHRWLSSSTGCVRLPLQQLGQVTALDSEQTHCLLSLEGEYHPRSQFYTLTLALVHSCCLWDIFGFHHPTEVKMPVSVPASWYIHSFSSTFYCVFLFPLFFFKKNLKFEWATSFLLKKNLYHFLIIFFWGNGRDVWGCDGIQLNAAKK